MKPPMMNGRPNDFQTPPEAIRPLLPYLKKDMVVWECASGKGNLVKAFEKEGYAVTASDILTGQNYLSFEPEKWDVCITNPPFSCKDEFLERAYSFGKPFAFLLPLTTFEGKKRQFLFRKHGIQVIFNPKRINFEVPSGNGSSSWFATAWFCWKFNLEKDMIFYEEVKA